jgi:PleD family two-component response regulator
MGGHDRQATDLYNKVFDHVLENLGGFSLTHEGRKMKILAVDDDRLQLDMLTAILKDAGYSDITTVTSGALALHELGDPNFIFDSILLDIQMPELDGIELCKIIRLMPKYQTTPILMITAMTDKSYIDTAFVSGATDYVTKPFDKMELVTRIKIAMKINSSNRAISEKIFTVKKLRDKIETDRYFDIESPVTIENVPGVVDTTILDNYLLQLSRIDSLKSFVFAIKIAEFADIYQRYSKVDLFDTLTDIAEIITENLTGGLFLVAYKGSGNFVCVVDRATFDTSSDLRTSIQSSIDEQGFRYADGKWCKISIFMSELQRQAILSFGSPLARVDHAILSVEKKASGIAVTPYPGIRWLQFRKTAPEVKWRSGE